MAGNPIEALTAAYADAVLAKDAPRLAALYDPDVRVFDAWGVWSYEGRVSWRANLEVWLRSLGDSRVQVSFEELQASIQGDTGFLSAFVTYADLDPSGQTQKAMQNRLTWALIRQGAGWAIALEHTSAPIRFDNMKAILKRE